MIPASRSQGTESRHWPALTDQLDGLFGRQDPVPLGVPDEVGRVWRPSTPLAARAHLHRQLLTRAALFDSRDRGGRFRARPH